MNFVEDVRLYIPRNFLSFKQLSWNHFHDYYIQIRQLSALPTPSLREI